MDVFDVITADPEAVKQWINTGLTPQEAQRWAACDVLQKELGERGADTPFRLWLRTVKHVNGWEPKVTPELWSEWLTERDAYTAALCAERAASEAAYKARLAAEHEARIASLRAEQERAAAEEIRWAAEKTRRARVAKDLQATVFAPVELNPVDWQELHKFKKHPYSAKRQLAARWRECFEALPEDVQTAWLAFYGPTTIVALPSDELVVDDTDSDVDPMGDDDDDDESDTASAKPDAITVHVTPLPPGQRDIDEYDADIVQAGIKHPAFRAFIPFSAGVRRLLDLIGNPIDNVILPPANPYRPQPAQDLDDIEAPTKAAYVVPGLIPSGGLTVPHGDPGACKSLLLQKIAVVVADRHGATFDGIRVEHGPVIYATLDPSASRLEIKPGVIEIRDRLGLKPSGRLHITDAPLILNEPSSVQHWIELNTAGLPAKLIVIDSLFSAVAGSLAQDTVVQGAMNGVRTLLRHADAVVTVHHDNKSGDIFGSQFLTAMMAAKIGVVRNVSKDGRAGNRVMVTVERLKFDPPTLKLAYTLDGPFLDLAPAAAELNAEGAPIRRLDILELLPTTPMPIRDARKLVDDKLGSSSPNARAEYWRRLRKDWEAAELIVVKDDTICRVS
jgi:hypothetical protein